MNPEQLDLPNIEKEEPNNEIKEDKNTPPPKEAEKKESAKRIFVVTKEVLMGGTERTMSEIVDAENEGRAEIIFNNKYSKEDEGIFGKKAKIEEISWADKMRREGRGAGRDRAAGDD